MIQSSSARPGHSWPWARDRRARPRAPARTGRTSLARTQPGRAVPPLPHWFPRSGLPLRRGSFYSGGARLPAPDTGRPGKLSLTAGCITPAVTASGPVKVRSNQARPAAGNRAAADAGGSGGMETAPELGPTSRIHGSYGPPTALRPRGERMGPRMRADSPVAALVGPGPGRGQGRRERDRGPVRAADLVDLPPLPAGPGRYGRRGTERLAAAGGSAGPNCASPRRCPAGWPPRPAANAGGC